MTKIVHPIAGMLAMLTMATFWLSTVISELSGSHAAIVAVKTAIPWGLPLLVLSLAAVGGSGFAWSKGNRSGLVGAKLLRMPFIAANGMLVLIPSALFLASKARAAELDGWFYGVQAVELVAGATNLTLLGMSMRDGLRLSRWRRQSLLKSSTTYTTKLLAREKEAEGTTTFHFERPAGFQFKAGQAIYLTLPASVGADSKGRMRTFSLSSSPHDPDLTITTRVGNSAFKKALQALPLGSDIEFAGPYGDMVLEETRPAVFIAGGIGITPFRSMIRDSFERGLRQRMVLFYSVRNAEDAAFVSELKALAEHHPRFELMPIITGLGEVPSAWQHGKITNEMIARHSGDLAGQIFYVAGPPTMVESVKLMLLTSGVARTDLHIEEFTGYRCCKETHRRMVAAGLQAPSRMRSRLAGRPRRYADQMLQSSNNAARIINVALIGRVKKTSKLPRESSIVRRNCCSMSGPSTKPRSMGATGKPKDRAP